MNKLASSLQQKYQNKRILILGFGREGQSTCIFLRKIFPEMALKIVDDQKIDLSKFNDKDLSFEEDGLLALNKYDVIFKSPGVSIREPALQEYLESGRELTSQLNEFLAVYKDQVIGVTGTKGKSTTSALIAHILNNSGKKTILAGNIGIPVFDTAEQVKDESFVVLEMSSYQLESVKHSPHLAVWLNLFPEHLNYHHNVENYGSAKAMISKWQTSSDVVFFNSDDKEIEIALQESKAQKIKFSVSSLDSELVQRDELQHLAGVVRKNNVVPALLVAQKVGIDREAAIKTLKSFSALPHRLEVVGEYKGIQFVDDTLATIPEATIEAIENFPNLSVILLGGFDRGIDYTPVVDRVVQKKVPAVIFFKPSGEKMYEIMKAKYPVELHPKVYFAREMKDAIEQSIKLATPESVVLLSPASPSFGQFKNYEEKSAEFVKWVKKFTQI